MSGAVEVRLENLRKMFGPTVAVDDVSITLAPGELVTLLGPSGCGKTTVLRMLAGLERATTGQIFIGNAHVTDLPPNARDTSMVFQSYALFPHMSVFENVAYGLRVAGQEKEQTRQAVEEALSMIGLGGLGDRSPSALSGGQQQRVALARALVTKPKVLLFDEPLSNLDAKLRKYMRSEIRDLQKKAGITSLYVTHDQAEAMAIADRIIVMNEGRIAQEGSPKELYTQPASRFVAEFIGEANFLPVQFEKLKDSKALVHLGDCPLTVDAPPMPAGPATLMIRPEAVLVEKRGSSLEGQITQATYLGSVVEFRVKTAAGELSGVAAPHETNLIEVGKNVGLTFTSEGTSIIPTAP